MRREVRVARVAGQLRGRLEDGAYVGPRWLAHVVGMASDPRVIAIPAVRVVPRLTANPGLSIGVAPDNSLCRKARALRQSRFSVRGDRPRTSAASSRVRPAKEAQFDEAGLAGVERGEPRQRRFRARMSMSGPGVTWFHSFSVTRRPAPRLAAPPARA